VLLLWEVRKNLPFFRLMKYNGENYTATRYNVLEGIKIENEK